MSRWTRACGPEVNLAIVVAPLDLTYLTTRWHPGKSTAYEVLKSFEVLKFPFRANQPNTYFDQNDRGDIPLQSWKNPLFLIFLLIKHTIEPER